MHAFLCSDEAGKLHKVTLTTVSAKKVNSFSETLSDGDQFFSAEISEFMKKAELNEFIPFYIHEKIYELGIII